VNLGAIRQAIADLASSVPGVRGYPYRPDNFVTSSGDGLVAAMLVNGEPYVDYLQAMSGGLSQIRFVMQVRSPAVAEISAQRQMDELVSAGLGEARSLIDAIKPDDLPQTLGGLIQDLKIPEVRMGNEIGPEGSIRYLGADFDIDVFARRLHQ
jgi:hypothetical protein